jgi:hypothetical protein
MQEQLPRHEEHEVLFSFLRALRAFVVNFLIGYLQSPLSITYQVYRYFGCF